MQGFKTRYAEACCDQDGRNWKLIQPIDYVAVSGITYRIPRGAATDGASTPAIVWSKIPPTGTYWLAAVLHDAAYQNTLEVVNVDGTVQKAALDKEACDNLLKEAMESTGVEQATVEIIYEAVRLFGSSAFKEDRS